MEFLTVGLKAEKKATAEILKVKIAGQTFLNHKEN